MNVCVSGRAAHNKTCECVFVRFSDMMNDEGRRLEQQSNLAPDGGSFMALNWEL